MNAIGLGEHYGLGHRHDLLLEDTSIVPHGEKRCYDKNPSAEWASKQPQLADPLRSVG